jgi:hypothetical protein
LLKNNARTAPNCRANQTESATRLPVHSEPSVHKPASNEIGQVRNRVRASGNARNAAAITLNAALPTILGSASG